MHCLHLGWYQRLDNLGVILCEVYSRGTWCLPVSLMVAVDINASVIKEAAKWWHSNSTISFHLIIRILELSL